MSASSLNALAGALPPAARRPLVGAATVVGGALGALAFRALRGSTTSVELTGVTTVAKPAEEVYAFWRRLQNLATFMAHVESVQVDATGRSTWRVAAPFGTKVTWQAEIVDDVPNERLAWRSVEGSQISNEGAVTFRAAPGDRGTEVHVQLRYEAPGGKLGEFVARVAGEDPHQQLDDDLRRFKQVMETGEVVRSDGAPRGKHARHEFPQRPAQPMSERERADVLQETR